MVNRERRRGACCCCVGCDSRKSSGVVSANPPVKGECGGSVAVLIGGVGIATWSEVCKYPVAVAGGRTSRGDGQGLRCTSDGVALLVMWIFVSSPVSH
jgi:hypothetical protein